MKRKKTIRIVLLISIAALALFSILAWRHSDKVSEAAPQRTEETTPTATPTVSATATPTATATETPVVTKPVGAKTRMCRIAAAADRTKGSRTNPKYNKIFIQ